MHVFQLDDRNKYPGSAPAIAISPDSWSDYGLNTTYNVTLWINQKERVDLPNVKIMQLGMKSGSPQIPTVMLDGLPEDCASLGADFDYYERILALDVALGDDIFASLRDLAVNREIHDLFSKDDAFHTSVIRLAPAKDALARLRGLEGALLSPDLVGVHMAELTAILRKASADLRQAEVVDTGSAAKRTQQSLRLKFTPRSRPDRELNPPSLLLDFDRLARLPSNVIAFVGPNGTGKTTLLSELAMVLFFDDYREEHGLGRVEIEAGSVRDVIFISYSAYDSFEIPDTQSVSADARSQLANQGYVYVGLRKLDPVVGFTDAAATNEQPDAQPHTLKSVGEINSEFMQLLARLRQADAAEEFLSFNRWKLFVEAIRELFEDPSLQAIATLPSPKQPADTFDLLAGLFPALSTGHKAILNIIASLCVHLNANSLVMMDEPEAHLHPPLVANLLKIVRNLLERFDANAIVATHSPIVIQETLGQHVVRFRRVANRTSWDLHPTQTFGENLATLTRETFGLPAARADFVSVLRSLVEGGVDSLQEIDKIFGDRGLSSPARAQALRLIAGKRTGDNE